MDWEALEQLVTVEQGHENPIALLIHKLLLDNDEVVLALPDIDNILHSNYVSGSNIHFISIGDISSFVQQ